MPRELKPTADARVDDLPPIEVTSIVEAALALKDGESLTIEVTSIVEAALALKDGESLTFVGGEEGARIRKAGEEAIAEGRRVKEAGGTKDDAVRAVQGFLQAALNATPGSNVGPPPPRFRRAAPRAPRARSRRVVRHATRGSPGRSDDPEPPLSAARRAR
jgi:hypothetical protein